MESWETNWLDYYEILDIDRNSSEEEIKKQYHKLMAKYHPDVYKGADGDEKAKQINEAYEILSDKTKKEKYDNAYDSRLNNESSNEDENNNHEAYEDVTYDEMKKDYTEEEQRYAEALALRHIIEENLEKVELIINAKNEIIFEGYSNAVSKEEYFSNVKEYIAIVNDYIISLKELAYKAYEMDLLTEEEKIYTTISFLENEIEKIPLSQKDAYFSTKKEMHKESLKKQVESEMINVDSLFETFNEILKGINDNKISHLEYDSIIVTFNMHLMNERSILKNLATMCKVVGMEDEEKKIVESLSKIDILSSKALKDYQIVKMYAEKEILKQQISEEIKKWEINRNKLNKILKIIGKYPYSHHCEYLYKKGLTIIRDTNQIFSYLKENKIDTINFKDLNKELLCYLKGEEYLKENNINMSELRILQGLIEELSEQAKKMYTDAKELQFYADNIYRNNESETLNTYNIGKIASSVIDVEHKFQAAEMIVEASLLKHKADDLDIWMSEDLELKKLCDKFKSLLKEIEGTESIFTNEYKNLCKINLQKDSPYSKAMNISIPDRIKKIKSEFGSFIKMGIFDYIGVNMILSQIEGYVERNENPDNLFILILIFLVLFWSAIMASNLNEIIKNVLKIKEELNANQKVK